MALESGEEVPDEGDDPDFDAWLELLPRQETLVTKILQTVRYIREPNAYYGPNSAQEWALKNIGGNRYRAVLLKNPTGSGKTLAYLVPLLQHVRLVGRGPVQAVIATNVAEQAVAIYQLVRFLAGIGNSYVAIGGSPKDGNTNKKDIQLDEPAIVVGTLGRLSELAAKGCFRSATFFVLDEAQVMLDRTASKYQMSWFEQSAKVYEGMARSAQVVAVTATLSAETRGHLRRLVGPNASILERPETTESKKLNKCCLSQYVMVFPNEAEKQTGLRNIFMDADSELQQLMQPLWQYMQSTKRDEETALLHRERFILFCNSVAAMETVTKVLAARTHFTTRYDPANYSKFAVYAVPHHNKMVFATERMPVFDAFAAGKITGLLSAGSLRFAIDVPQICLVINYQIPMRAEEFVHQSGRIGRGAAVGHVLNMVVRGAEQDRLKRFARELGITLDEVDTHLT